MSSWYFDKSVSSALIVAGPLEKQLLEFAFQRYETADYRKIYNVLEKSVVRFPFAKNWI